MHIFTRIGSIHPSKADKAWRKRRLTFVLSAVVLATSLYANIPHFLGLQWFLRFVPPFTGFDSWLADHLGGENRFIATALVAGRGFSDPFGEPTGPTAWMPPVLASLQSVPMAVGGVPLATITMVVFQNLSLIFTGWLVLRAANRSEWRYAPVVAAILFVGTTWYHFFSCYQSTHDSWLIMFWVGLLVYMADRLGTSMPTKRSGVGWGLVGGLATLSGPQLGPVWAMLTLYLVRTSRTITPFLVSGLAALLVVAPWTIRNGVVFQRFIPIKSNLFFELYQSNVLEPDGVLRLTTFHSHPYNDGLERSRYRELGEMRYLDDIRTRFLDALWQEPMGYVKRVANRLSAVTVFYYAHTNAENGIALAISDLIHPLPFWGFMLMLVRPGWSRDRLKVIAVIVYVTYLVPYVLVAYYERYGLPLLGVQVLFVLWGLESLWSLRGRGRIPWPQ